MILDEAAVAPKHRAFSAPPKPFQRARRYLEIGGGLFCVEEGRATLGAVGSLDFIVVHMSVIPVRGGCGSAGCDTGHAGADTA